MGSDVKNYYFIFSLYPFLYIFKYFMLVNVGLALYEAIIQGREHVMTFRIPTQTNFERKY